MKTKTSWDGTRIWIGVVGVDGGVWWPHDEAQDDIDESSTPKQRAIQICEKEPMRGEWRDGA